MRILGVITIIIGASALLLTVLHAALTGSDGIAWTPLLAGLLAITVGQNCIVIARVQGRLQTMEDKLSELRSAFQSQESLRATQQMEDELQEQGLLREMGTTVHDDVDEALE